MEKIEEGMIEQTDGGTGEQSPDNSSIGMRVPLVRRPSFISVLKGTHWTQKLDRKCEKLHCKKEKEGVTGLIFTCTVMYYQGWHY